MWSNLGYSFCHQAFLGSNPKSTTLGGCITPSKTLNPSVVRDPHLSHGGEADNVPLYTLFWKLSDITHS